MPMPPISAPSIPVSYSVVEPHPQNSVRPDYIDQSMEDRRQSLRRQVNEQFLNKRRTAVTEAYTLSYEQATAAHGTSRCIRCHQRVGTRPSAIWKTRLRSTLLAGNGDCSRQVSPTSSAFTPTTTHNENFGFHLEQMGDFDQPFATFVQDIADRGLLDQTLIVVLSEFGRTPNINLYYGRDHWSKAWSVVMGGANVQRGGVYGKTNETGTEVIDGKWIWSIVPHLPSSRGRRFDSFHRRRWARLCLGRSLCTTDLERIVVMPTLDIRQAKVASQGAQPDR